MGAFFIEASGTTGANSFAHAVCNTTDECTAIDPNMACSNNLCICPSAAPGPMTAHGSLCYATAASLFAHSLGAVCTADTNCSSSALCLAGQCSCPPGFQPWDDYNCTVIQTVDPSSSWTSLLLPLSGFVLIILAVCFCASTQWSSGPRWAKSYIGDKESAPTLIVWSQASIGDQTFSGPLELHPASQNTDSPVQQQHMDSELFSGGFYSPRDSWLAAVAERSSELTNQLNSVTELRGLCSAPEEPFVRPVLSGEEMYSKYPHLRLILSSTSSSSAQVAAERSPASLIPCHTEITPSASRQSTESELSSSKGGLRSALQSPTNHKCAPRSESPSKHVAFPEELVAPSSSVVQPESESELLGQRSAGLQPFRTSSSTPWSTFGSSLDSLLSTPVVARVVTSSSCTDNTVLRATTLDKSKDHQLTLSTSSKTSGKAHG